MNPVVSIQQPLKHYVWGEGCDGWNLVDGPGLSVKQERMPRIRKKPDIIIVFHGNSFLF